jgi:hypothetical protein
VSKEISHEPVFLTLLRRVAATPTHLKFFGVGAKNPLLSLRFCVADGAKGAQKGALQRRSGASCGGFVEDLWRICGFGGNSPFIGHLLVFAIATGRIPFVGVPLAGALDALLALGVGVSLGR